MTVLPSSVKVSPLTSSDSNGLITLHTIQVFFSFYFWPNKTDGKMREVTWYLHKASVRRRKAILSIISFH